MAKFIEVSDTSTDQLVTINVQQILAISPRGNGAQIGLVGSMGIKTTNSYDDVVSKINAAIEV